MILYKYIIEFMDNYGISADVEVLMQDETNRKCNDCESKNPKWISTNNAVFLCLKCAGSHRSLGNTVSIIKSIGMDPL